MLLLLALVPLASSPQGPQAPYAELVADLSAVQAPLDSEPSAESDSIPGLLNSFAQLGSGALFFADAPATGRALWKATASGVELVADVTPGPIGNDGALLFEHGGEVYFRVERLGEGIDLYRTDGTTAGTRLAFDYQPGQEDFVGPPVFIGSKLVFGGTEGGQASTAHAWDSTTGAVTELLTGGYATFGAFALEPSGASALVQVTHFRSGRDLCRTDGTPQGTQVLDIFPGYFGGFIGLIGSFGGVFYLSLNLSGLGPELYRTDGTAAGTTLVADIMPGSQGSAPAEFFEWNGVTYFAASGPEGRELWTTDGTAAGTKLVADLVPGPDSGRPGGFVEAGGKLFFYTNYQAGTYTGPVGLGVFDGQQAKVIHLAAVAPGFGVAFGTAIPFGSGLLFTATTTEHGSELWFTDGTEAGTQLVADVEPGPSSSSPSYLTPLPSGGVLFAADRSDVGRELFLFDGSSASLLADLMPGSASNSSGLDRLVSVDGERLYFTADLGVQLQQTLWSYSRDEGVRSFPVTDTGAAIKGVDNLTAAFTGGEQRLFFTGSPAALEGQERLYVLDARADAPRLLPGGVGASSLVVGKGKLYWRAKTAGGSFELHETDGTAAGTVVPFVLKPGSGTGSRPLGHCGDRLMLRGWTAATGLELFAYDEVAGTATLVKDVRPGPATSQIQPAFERAGKFYFTATDGTIGVELWETDGTTAGTVLVADLSPGTVSSSPKHFFHDDSGVFFFAGPSFGEQLWFWDFAAPPVALVGLQTGLGFGDHLALNGGVFYFPHDEPIGSAAHYPKLWRSDGTVAGTYQVSGDWAGSEIRWVRYITAVGDHVVFNASSVATNSEVFVSDGTKAGTKLLVDVNPGGAGSGPTAFAVADGDLYFTAVWGPSGYELVGIPNVGAYATALGAAAPGARLAATTPHLGGSVTFDASSIPPGELSALLVGLPPKTMTPFLTAPGYGAWVGPSAQLVGPVQQAMSWSWSVAIPNQPALAGRRVNAQVFHSPYPAAPAATSNGVALVLGP